MTTRENDITESFTGDRMSILNEIAAVVVLIVIEPIEIAVKKIGITQFA